MKNMVGLMMLVFFIDLAVKASDVFVDINVETKHVTGGVDTFIREKFITIHSSNYEDEWDSIPREKDYLINKLDVYFGRETGNLALEYTNLKQDRDKPGFADEEFVKERADKYKRYYASRTEWHPYEKRQQLIVASQDRLFPSEKHKTKAGWGFPATDTDVEPFGTAMGRFAGLYMKHYFGIGGESGLTMPAYFEVINEPIWPLVEFGDESIDDIFKLHSTVAKEVKTLVPNAKVGGYTTAFPEFDRNNFKQWDERWKRFIDECGDDMDFYSFHLYDFPGVDGGMQIYRKGSNNEAVFDMLNHYSILKNGELKPLLVSEYGSQLHDWYGKPWSSYRDWLILKAVSSMLMQFMERPDEIVKTIPFSIIKAEWGFGNFADNGVPYYWRLLRRENEPESYSGDWIWTDLIYFYELWSEVKGTRVDTKASDPDIQADAYINDKHLYVILNSLELEAVTIDLNMFGLQDNDIQSVNTKHLFFDDEVVYKTQQLEKVPDKVILESEATMILDYTLSNTIELTKTSNESKYYAHTYLQPIKAGITDTFIIDGVKLNEYGEAVLRLGLGRNHGLSLQPEVKVNNAIVDVPSDFRGHKQTDRYAFFGVIEIPVPYQLLAETNTVTIAFNDEGGHISSLVLQVFNFSDKINRSNRIPVTSIKIQPDEINVMASKEAQLSIIKEPVNSSCNVFKWSSNKPEVAMVDPFSGVVKGISKGKAVITVSTFNGDITDKCKVRVLKKQPVAVTGVDISRQNIDILAGDKLLLPAEIVPTIADNKAVSWYSTDTAIATVNAVGLVLARKPGSATVVATSYDGNFVDSCKVLVSDKVEPSINFKNQQTYLDTEYRLGEVINVTCEYEAGSGDKARSARIYLREVTKDWGAVSDIIVDEDSIKGTQNGEVTVQIKLDGIKPSSELREGNFYFLFAQIKTLGGVVRNAGLFPIKITE